MSRKLWPYNVVISLHKSRFKELLNWLHDEGHVLRETIKFGEGSNPDNGNTIVQSMLFKDGKHAMMFKLAWG